MVTAARRMAASPDAVWDVLVETRHWPTWGPTVTAVDGPERIASGSTGRVRTPVGLWVPFEVTGFVDGECWSWSVAGVPATGHRVRAADGGTEVEFTAPTWAFAYVPVLHLGLRRIEALVTG